ncbi:MAG: PqqD family protein [Deltaproteobacteria bacterium]|nr:PqqD family protein [Deltaproteobacteria bacterium]
MLTDQLRFRRHPDVAFRVIDGQAVIVVPATQSMHTLNEVGTFVWERCEGRTVDEIVGLLVEEFEVDDATARGDLETFARELGEKRMLVVE